MRKMHFNQFQIIHLISCKKLQNCTRAYSINCSHVICSEKLTCQNIGSMFDKILTQKNVFKPSQKNKRK